MSTRYAIGIDLGGTKTAGGLVDVETGEIVEERHVATDAGEGGQAVLDRVKEMARTLKSVGDSCDRSPAGIGIGIAELVDLNGQLTSFCTIDWSDVDYQGELNGILPTVIDSDIRTAALAEARFGLGKGLRSFVYVSVGTGIGGCLVLDGIPVAGARGNAMILGSGRLSVVCGDCGQMQSSVLEEIASGPGILETFRSSGGAADRCEDVFARAADGEDGAIDVLRNAGHALGVSVGFLVNLTDPEAVIVGGGVGLAGGCYRDAFLASVRSHVWAESTRALDIVPSTFGAHAGCVGAAIMCPESSCADRKNKGRSPAPRRGESGRL